MECVNLKVWAASAFLAPQAIWGPKTPVGNYEIKKMGFNPHIGNDSQKEYTLCQKMIFVLPCCPVWDCNQAVYDNYKPGGLDK